MKKKIPVLLIIAMLLSVFQMKALTADAKEITTYTEVADCEHKWSNVDFVWEDDYTCIASRTCSECLEIEEKDCTVTRKTTKNPTCTKKGAKSCTAKVNYDGKDYTNTKSFSVASTGHKYSGNKCKKCGVLLLSKPSISVKTHGMKKIKITWKKVKNASGYYIYRSESKKGKYTKIKTASASSTSYVDNNRTTGKTYYYKVYAYKGKVKSSESKIVSGKAGLTAPVMKTSVSATKSTIKISWGKVSGAKGYVVYRKKGSGSWKQIFTINSGSTVSYKDQSVSGAYEYTVKAFTKVNDKTIYSSKATSIKTRTLNKPSIKVSHISESWNNKITWKKIPGAVKYQVYYKVDKNGSWKEEMTVGNVTSYKTKDVTHGKYYYYKLRAIYQNGDIITYGEFSNEDNMLQYYKPKLSVFMSSKTDSSCTSVAVILENKGVGKVRVYAKGARMVDRDYESFNRNFDGLYDEDIKKVSYIDIPAGESRIFVFSVQGNSTWYDSKTSVVFDIFYDGMNYTCYASRYYGISCYEK